jgi:hypothetical protein
MGVTIDVGGRGVEIATTADLSKHFADMYDWLLASTVREEIPIDLANSKTTPAVPFTYTYLDLGGPKPGWLWDLMRLAINGNDPTATVTGNVWAFIAGTRAPADSATIDLYPQLIEIGNGTIPNSAFYSRQQVIVRPGQHIILGMKSLPASTNINGSGLAIQYRDPSAGTAVNTLRPSK